jgi:hypothetical protein
MQHVTTQTIYEMYETTFYSHVLQYGVILDTCFPHASLDIMTLYNQYAWHLTSDYNFMTELLAKKNLVTEISVP